MAKKTYPKILSNRYGKVRIYEVKNRDKWLTYVVAWCVGRRRIRKSFSDEVAAENHAEVVLKQYENGQALAGNLTSSEALYFEACKRRLGGVPLMTAVEYYLKMHGQGEDSSLPTGKIRELFLKELGAKGNSYRDIKTVSSHTKMFCDAITGPITGVRATDIDAFLQGQEWSNRYRNNIRTSICRMFSWAKTKGHIPRSMANAAEDSTTYKAEVAASPGIFTPEHMAEILGAASDEWVPYFAVGAFGGLRSAEICRLKWEDIRMEEKVIILGSDITKTSRRRVVHMPDNLVAWLESYEGEKQGEITPGVPTKEICRISKEIGKEWVDNGLRHSYISYQMALWRDAARVAEQCGNSVEQVQASYKANALESEANRWFAITPG